MTQCFGSDSQYVQKILDALVQEMEQHFSFPRGALKQRQISHFPLDVNKAVWTDYGGVVACSDENIAANIAEVIIEHVEKDYMTLLSKLQKTLCNGFSAVSCRLDVSFYCCRSSISLNNDWRESIEMLRGDDLNSEDFSPPNTAEHVFAIKDDSVVAAYAYNIPQLKINGHWFHAVGARTHPDYRKRGLGKAVVSALVEHITSEGGVALWTSDVRNIASLKLARSVGFVEYIWIFSWK